jgi:hypothetical protein
MAIVRMNTELGKFRYSDGYYDCTTTYYVYCNKCGSFSVEEYRSIKTWAEVTLGILLAALGGISVRFMVHFSEFMAFASCLVLVLIALDMFFTYAIYANGGKCRCRKCGNAEITGGNVLNYPEEDRSLIDVPDYLTHKSYDYTYA